MDPLSVIVALVQMVSGLPVVGKFVAIALGSLVALSTAVTGAVAAWHGLVVVCNALASLPGLSGLKSLAASLQADSAVIDADSNELLSWINRLSVIAIPQAAAPVAPPVAPQS